MHSSSEYGLVSTMKKSDDCRPENFDSSTADTEKCQFDCLTMIVYDYIGKSKIKLYIDVVCYAY